MHYVVTRPNIIIGDYAYYDLLSMNGGIGQRKKS